MGKGNVQHDTPKRIKSLQFSVFSPQDIVRLSEFEVTTRDLYTVADDGTKTPARQGLLDRRLGVSDKESHCETCHQRMADCVGHYAYIKLVLPVYHIGYFKQVVTMLQDICKTCAHVLLDENDRRTFLKRFRRPNLENLQRQSVAKAVNTACRKVVHCPYCGAINGTVKKIGPLKIVHEKFRAKKVQGEQEEFQKTFTNAVGFQPELRAHVRKAQEDLNPLRVLELFKRISAEDCELLGLHPDFGRPEEYIWQYISVPPVCIRPSVAQDGATNEDDLTVKLGEIVFANQLIISGLAKGVTTVNLIEYWDFLQLSIAMYINSEMPGIPPMANHKPIRGFCQRLKGKQGRFRGNLSGKRVDFSGRTVISPDPNLRIDELAVPEKIAKKLTYPERVTEHNIASLRQAIKNGHDVWPGANFIQDGSSPQGLKRFLAYVRSRDETAERLRVGDVVERHLKDGDLVLFNRQPSLHKLSIMCHRVKVRPWKTLRFNECVCNPYNADFDGDEMNLHVPQTEESRTEALELMSTKKNIVTPRNGEPIIAAIQDFITASYLLSRKDKFYDRQQFTQICSYLQDAELQIDLPPPTVWKPVRLWTGKQVFNLLMKPNKQSNVLVNLEAKCRTLEPPSKESGFPLDMSPNDGYLVIVNSEIMCGVMDKSTVGDGKKNSVFGVILRDYGSDEAAVAMNRLAKLCARWLANVGFSLGINDVIPGPNLSAQKNIIIQKAYDVCADLIDQAKKGLLKNAPGSDQAGTLEIKVSGELSGVRAACGELCMAELSRHNAPATMATCGSKGSKLNVSQMVAVVGQQIISGSRVPDGFQDRFLPHFKKKAREPPAKGFVANSFFSGLTPTEFLAHAISGREGLVDTAVKTAETGYMQRRLMKALEDLSTRYDDSVRNSVGLVVQFKYGDDGLDPACLEGDSSPVAFTRSWAHAKAIAKTGGASLLPREVRSIVHKALRKDEFMRDCEPKYIETIEMFVDGVLNKMAELRVLYGMSEANEKPDGWRGVKKVGVKVEGNTDGTAQKDDIKAVDNLTRVTEQQVQAFMDICYVRYLRAKIEPGSTVGAVGAQSIGEPGTQMTLKTFHFAGVAAMSITLGVPRIKEIINAAKLISTPIIAAKLTNPNHESAARIVKGRLEKTYLKDITKVVEEAYGALYSYIGIHIDMDVVHKLGLELTLDEIKWAIVGHRKLKVKQGNITIVPHNNRIRIYVDDEEDRYFRLRQIKRELPDIVVKGIPTVNRAVISKQESDQSKNILFVEGYGLREVMNTEGVIGEETTTNHIMEMAAVLGIEAARATIIKQIDDTMSSHGLGVDPRHTGLLGDVMTYKGEVLGITRFGVSKMKDSVLMLASFEKTTDHLFDAALYAKKDAIQGVSESIIMGQPAEQLGTSMPALIVPAPELPPLKSREFDGTFPVKSRQKKTAVR